MNHNSRLYRYEYTVLADDNGAIWYVRIELRQHRVIRETPCGYWVELLGIANERHIGNRSLTRWVKAGSGKRFAHESMEWAWESFQRKRYSNQYHLQRKLADVEAVIKHMESTGMPDLHSGGTCTNLKAPNRSIKQLRE